MRLFQKDSTGRGTTRRRDRETYDRGTRAAGKEQSATDATSNYFTNRLPTKTIQGYITPIEALTKHRPDLSHLRIWGCKAYVKLPRNYSRKDFKDKSLVGHFIGYSKEGEIGYKVFIPEHKVIVVGVHVLFNEIIPERLNRPGNDQKKRS